MSAVLPYVSKFRECHPAWNKHWLDGSGIGASNGCPAGMEILPNRVFSPLNLSQFFVSVFFLLFIIFLFWPFHFFLFPCFVLWSIFVVIRVSWPLFHCLASLFLCLPTRSRRKLSRLSIWRLISSHAHWPFLFIFPQRPCDYNRSNDGTDPTVQWQNS